MNTDSNPFTSNKLALKGAIYVVICLAALSTTRLLRAETIYRTADPDGRVTYTDKLPASTNQAAVLGIDDRPISAPGSVLPMGLRQISIRYPVTLYSSSHCAPCDSGRALLAKRGIPFVEKTVNSTQDAEALRRISGSSSLPFLTIGSQHIKGFSDSQWTQFLDAADYPQSSALPTGYRFAQPTPLVAPQKMLPVAKPDEAPVPFNAIDPVPESTNEASNPAGIKF